jgi:hypothetical protein
MTSFLPFGPRRLKDWVVDLIGAAISEGKFIDCDREQTAGLLLNFDEGAQKRTRMHTDQGDRVEEATCSPTPCASSGHSRTDYSRPADTQVRSL